MNIMNHTKTTLPVPDGAKQSKPDITVGQHRTRTPSSAARMYRRLMLMQLGPSLWLSPKKSTHGLFELELLQICSDAVSWT
jgi:hypothetical protein